MINVSRWTFLLAIVGSLVCDAAACLGQTDDRRSPRPLGRQPIKVSQPVRVSPGTSDWPQFFGPNRNGVSHETGWLVEWPEAGPKRLWQTRVGGSRSNNGGTSSVAVVGQRLYTMGRDAKTRQGQVVCLDAGSGKVLWTQAIQGDGHSTPSVDDGFVYAYSVKAHLLCLDSQSGKVIWGKTPKELAAQPASYGYASSPLVTDNLVIVPVRRKDASIVALDKKTGKEVWQAFHAANQLGGFWYSPVLASIDGQRCVVYLTGRGGEKVTSRLRCELIFQSRARPTRSAAGCTEESARWAKHPSPTRTRSRTSMGSGRRGPRGRHSFVCYPRRRRHRRGRIDRISASAC
jgi:hypothetical protein